MNRYADKYSALSSREKMLILASFVVVLYLLFNLIFFGPMDKKQVTLTQERDAQQQTVNALSVQMASYALALTKDPDQAKKDQLASLKNQLQTLNSSLQEASVGLIPSEQLPQLLQQVLSGMTKLDLVNMQTLPVEELLLEDPTQTEGLVDERIDDTAVGVFKHGVEVIFKGRYFDVIAYLKQLESLGWRFYWDLLDYDVEQHPDAQVRLRVYTLSTEIGAFGGL